MSEKEWGDATQTLLDELTAQSTEMQARILLASLSLVQDNLRQWQPPESLTDRIQSLVQVCGPPLQRCATIVTCHNSETTGEIVHLQWPFFGAATVNPRTLQIVITPRAHPPREVDWALPNAWVLFASLPPALTPEEQARVVAMARAKARAEQAALEKRRASLVETAPELRSLEVREPDTVAIELLAGLEFPQLQVLTLASPGLLLAPAFHHLPSLTQLTLGDAEASSALFTALAESPIWRQVRHLSASFYRTEANVEWSRLWDQPGLQFAEIRLHCTETAPADALVRAALPKLRSLTLSGQIRDPFLETIAATSLPALEDLDLRNTAITADATREFARAFKPGLPRLQRLGIDFPSDVQEDYLDWNGQAVDRGFRRMTPAELHGSFLAGTGLALLPEIF